MVRFEYPHQLRDHKQWLSSVLKLGKLQGWVNVFLPEVVLLFVLQQGWFYGYSALLLPLQSLFSIIIYLFDCEIEDRLCGLVVRVPGYRSKGPVFDSRRYQIFWEVVALEWGHLSLMGTIEGLLERNNSGSGLKTENTAVESIALTTRHPLSTKSALTSPTSGGRSFSIVHSWTKAMEISFSFMWYWNNLLTKIFLVGFECIMGASVANNYLYYFCSLTIRTMF
jgi:hypothetical protein